MGKKTGSTRENSGRGRTMWPGRRGRAYDGTLSQTKTTEAGDSGLQAKATLPVTVTQMEDGTVLPKTQESAAFDGTEKPTQTSPQARGWIRSFFLDPISSFCSSRPVFTGVAGTLVTGAALWYLDSCLGGSLFQDHALKDSVIVPAATGFIGSSGKGLSDLGSSLWSHLPEASAVRNFGTSTTGATLKAAKSGLSATCRVPSRLLGPR